MEGVPPSSASAAEEQARLHVTEFERFLIQVTEKRGGKTGLIFLYLGLALPFIFNVVVLLIVSTSIWPLTSTVTEKMAVLGFLFLVLNAIAYQVKGTANSVLTVMFLTRRRKKLPRPRK